MLRKIFNAMATMEGWGKPGKIPTVRHNPLNLRYEGQEGALCRKCGLRNGNHAYQHPCERGHDIAEFSADGIGTVAGYRQLCKWIQSGMSLRQMISTHAPATENDTEGYLQYVARTCLIDPDRALYLYIVD